MIFSIKKEGSTVYDGDIMRDREKSWVKGKRKTVRRKRVRDA